MGVLLSSSLLRNGLAFVTWPTHPNMRKNVTFGLRLFQALYDVHPSRALVGERLSMNTAVLTASPRNSAGIRFAFIIERAMPPLHYAVLLR